MVSKRIIWSSRANYELKEILNFYNKRNGNSNYSKKSLDEVESNLKSLSKNEYLGRLTTNKKTRVLVLKVFFIFYEFKNNQINILSFWDNRQDLIKRIDQ